MHSEGAGPAKTRQLQPQREKRKAITYLVLHAVAEHHVAPLPPAGVQRRGRDHAFQDGLLAHFLSDPGIVQRDLRGVCRAENVL